MGDLVEPLTYDDATADALISAFRVMGDHLSRSLGPRDTLVHAAMTDFKGAFSRLFQANGDACAGQAKALADECMRAAVAVDQAKSSAAVERLRRLREEESLRMHRGRTHALLPGDPPDYYSVASPEPEPVYEARTPTITRRDHPTMHGPAGDSGGPVGGDPIALNAFADGAEMIDQDAADPLARVRGALEEYGERCRWGHLGASSIVKAGALWSQQNDGDRAWARQLAAAFLAAGADADIATVESLATRLPPDEWSVVQHGIMLGLLKSGSADDIRTFFVSHADKLEQFQSKPPPIDEIRSWWKALNSADRERLTTAAPEAIGNLPGVPYKTRDVANRNWLKSELHAEREHLESVNSDTYLALSPDALTMERTNAEDRLQKLEGLERAMSEGVGKGSGRHLVQFLPAGGNPKASICSGDLDTAARVAIMTPGIRTTARNAPETVAADESIQTTAEAMKRYRTGDASPSLAMVTFLNYDPPGWDSQRYPASVLPWGDEIVGGAEEAAKSYAVNGGERLAGFMVEIKSSKGWSDQDEHLSVIGHSYGTTTTAEALRRTGAGKFINLASAGFYTDETQEFRNYEGLQSQLPAMPSDLKVPEGQISAATSPNDSLARLGVRTALDGQRVDPDAYLSPSKVNQFSAEDGIVPASARHILGGDGRLHAPYSHNLSEGSGGSTYGYADAGSSTNFNTGAEIMGYRDMEVH